MTASECSGSLGSTVFLVGSKEPGYSSASSPYFHGGLALRKRRSLLGPFHPLGLSDLLSHHPKDICTALKSGLGIGHEAYFS